MSESFEWAPYSRVREAAEELKGLIRARFPEADFRLVRSEHSRRAWHLLVTTDGDDSLEIRDLVVDREVDMLAEEHIPIHVIPLQRDAATARTAPPPMRKTG